MKIPAIKKLVDECSVDDLKKAEGHLTEDLEPEITIDGEDEGEMLTHVIAALWIKEHMEQEGVDYKKALRAYTNKVRTSIS